MVKFWRSTYDVEASASLGVALHHANLDPGADSGTVPAFVVDASWGVVQLVQHRVVNVGAN